MKQDIKVSNQPETSRAAAGDGNHAHPRDLLGWLDVDKNLDYASEYIQKCADDWLESIKWEQMTSAEKDELRQMLNEHCQEAEKENNYLYLIVFCIIKSDIS